MPARFAVYHNIPKASDIKIHHIDYTAYTRRDPAAENSDWHTAPDLQAATDKARALGEKHNLRYRDCKWCRPSRF